MLGEEVRVLQALEYSFATVHPNQFVLAAVKKLFPRGTVLLSARYGKDIRPIFICL